MIRRHIVRQIAIVAMVALAITAVVSVPIFTSQPPNDSATRTSSAEPGLRFIPTGTTERQSPVEHYSDWQWLPGPLDCSGDEHCIVNPTECSWDVDDHWQKFALPDSLAAGGSVSDTSCVIASQDPVYIGRNGVFGWMSSTQTRFNATVDAPSGELAVTINWQPQNRTFTLPGVLTNGTYHYALCITAEYNPGDPALVPIAGSNASLTTGTTDAMGVPSTVVFTIANPTNKQIRNVSSTIGMTGSGPCPRSGGLSYPFQW